MSSQADDTTVDVKINVDTVKQEPQEEEEIVELPETDRESVGNDPHQYEAVPNPHQDLTAAESFGSNICWFCHYEMADHGCKSCPRFYHKNCIRGLEEYPSAITSRDSSDAIILEKCQECMVSNVTSLEPLKSLTTAQFKMLMTAFCKRWIEWLEIPTKNEPSYIWALMVDAKIFDDLYEDMVIVLKKVTDMQTIQTAVAIGEIRTMEGFAAEMRLMHHNSVIFNGRLDDNTRCITEFLEGAFADLNKMIWTCMDCQLRLSENPNDRSPDFFIELCKIPHLVIWAKVVGYPYWPAKIISSNSNGNTVDVLFFHSHDTANVKLRDCAIYSRALAVHPSDRKRARNAQMTADVKLAVQEANNFLNAMAENQKFGKQVLMEEMTPVVPFENLTPDFIRTLFPDIDPDVLETMLHPPSSMFRVINFTL